MPLPPEDVQIRYTKGRGPGGQHKNKTASCVVATHLPTGLTIRIDGRCQHTNKRQALERLAEMVENHARAIVAAKRKADRDRKIREVGTIRTYDFRRKTVKDHRTGKTASIREILEDGMLELLR